MTVDFDIIGQLRSRCWYRCLSCQFTGESIELHQQAKGFTDPRQVITDMTDGGIALLPDSRDLVRRYVNVAQPLKGRIAALWDVARGNVAADKLTPGYAKVLAEHSLKLGWSARDLARWFESNVGAIRYKEAVALLRTNSQNTKLKAWRSRSLVFGFQRSPGRVSSFLFVKQPVETLYTPDPSHKVINDEDCLAFLDQLQPSQEIVYAVDDVVLGAQMHAVNSIEGSQPLPLVVYRNGTTNAWYHVRGESVIFWVNRLTPEVVTQALRVHNGHISVEVSKPITHEEAYMQLVTGSLGLRLATIRAISRPWHIALKRYILDNESEAVDFVSKLELTAEDRTTLLSCCTRPAARAAVEKALNISKCYKSIVINGCTVEERDDGYWCVLQLKGAYKLADFTFGPITTVRVPKENATYCSGDIIAGGRRIPYSVNKECMRYRMHTWVESVFLDAGRPAPVIESKWFRRLLNIALQMNPTSTTIVISDTVGWDSSRECFSFPRFQVKGGDIERFPPTRADLSCSGLQASFKASNRECCQNATESTRAFWCMLIAVLRNLLAPVYGWPVVGIGVVADNWEQEHSAAKKWCEAVGLLTTRLPLVAESNMDGVPILLEGCPKVARQWVGSGVRVNAIAVVDKKTAQIALLRNEWILVFVGRQATCGRYAKMVAILPEILAWLQRTKPQVKVTNPLGRVRTLVGDWITESLPPKVANAPAELLTALKTDIQGGEAAGSSTGERVLQFLSKLHTSKAPIISSDDITVDSDTVVLNTVAITARLSRAGYPVTAEMIDSALYDSELLLDSATDGSVRIALSDWV